MVFNRMCDADFELGTLRWHELSDGNTSEAPTLLLTVRKVLSR